MKDRLYQPWRSAAYKRSAVLLVVLGISFSAAWAGERFGERTFRTSGTSTAVATQGQIVNAQRANDIWLIDARRANPRELPPRLSYYRYQAGRFVMSTAGEFLAVQDMAMPTCFWVHGNRVADAEAVSRGFEVYKNIKREATRPFRLVIWSWPSTQIEGAIRDVQQKAQLSDLHAVPLAWLVRQMDPRAQVSFLGYSYGARMIGAVLHLLDQPAVRRPPMQVVLMGAAMDNTSFQPGGRNGRALSHVGQMLITVNLRDQAMQWYQVINGVPGPHALGYTGAAGVPASNIWHMDVGPWLKTSHDLSGYLRVTKPAKWLGLSVPTAR